jgi:hypothetical protein
MILAAPYQADMCKSWPHACETGTAFPSESTPVDLLANGRPVFSSIGRVKGHWVGEHMVGPESSDISCDKKEGTCTDTRANIIVMGGTFVMSGDTAEYTVQRWNAIEIVAVHLLSQVE